MGDNKLKGVSEVMRPFSGDGDVVAWLKKAELVAKLKKIEDVASFLPLYLEGDALALYLEMREEDQSNATSIVERLKEAFTDGEFAAYGKLGRVKWAGEQVDVFANEVRRLAGLAGYTGEGLERTVKLTFVNGFPDHISLTLQQLPDIGTVAMGDLIPKARILAARKAPDVAVVAVKGAGSDVRQNSTTGKSDEQSFGKGGSRSFKGKCFRCNGPHMMRDCKEPKALITCFRCGGTGHISTHCDQGNEQRGATMPVATPSNK